MIENIVNVILFLSACYVLMLVTWLFYLAAMNLIKLKDELTGMAKFNGYILIIIGVTLDFLLNAIVGSLLFLEPPREWLLTDRLQRHKKKPDHWRFKIANYICGNLLNPFDPDHC